MDNASVLTVGRTQVRGGVVHGSSFQVKVASPTDIDEEATPTDVVVAAVVAAFGDELDITRPLGFDGAGSADHAAHTYPIARDTLGANIERPGALDRVSEFLGGVAVVVDDIDPPVTLEDVEKRISRMRGQPDFAKALGRNVGVFGLEADEPEQLGHLLAFAALTIYVVNAEALADDIADGKLDGTSKLPARMRLTIPALDLDVSSAVLGKLQTNENRYPVDEFQGRFRQPELGRENKT